MSRGECGGELDWLKYVPCEGDESDPGKYKGMVGINSKTCCTVARATRDPGPLEGDGSGPFITPCTRGSCDTVSSQPSGPGVAGGMLVVFLPS